jgi:predicted RNase H-like nuclease (RuvC/YqgF family)
MKKEITLESLYDLLSGFISKQEAFNSKQEAFNSKQEAFNSKQEAFNSKQESFNSRLEDRLDRFQEEEKANHNLTHRMIGQAFEHISDIESHLTDKNPKWNTKVI